MREEGPEGTHRLAHCDLTGPSVDIQNGRHPRPFAIEGEEFAFQLKVPVSDSSCGKGETNSVWTRQRRDSIYSFLGCYADFRNPNRCVALARAVP